MDLLHNLYFGFGVALSLQNLLYCFIGVLVGTLIGVLPGIGPLATIAMLLPITYNVPPVAALIMLAGIYYGAQYGGSTTSILVNLPGETASVITCIDGYQMARQGRAGVALAIAAIGSFIAGTICTILIAAIGPSVADVALKFGSPEYFSLMLLGLVTATVLAQGDMLKSLAMMVLGLTLGIVGSDVDTGIKRFTFGFFELADGIGFVIIAVGVFAVGEIISNLSETEERVVFKTLLKRESFRFMAFGALLAAVFAFSASSALAAAAAYPQKPVRLLIAFAPGGSTDAMGRLIATKLSERLGKQFVAENMAGGGGAMASETVARSAPDGHTLLFNSTGIILNPMLAPAPYDPMKSFTPIAKIGNAVSTLVVHPSVPANSLKELIALAKKQPGKLVASAAGGGSFIHLSTEYFKMMADIDFKIVQFKGGGPAMVDLLGGHSQLFVGSLQQSLPHIKSGKVRALGYGAKSRSKFLPDLPTVSEAGLPGFECFIWWGLYAPAGTPKAIVDTLNTELAAIMKMPDIIKTFESQGAEQDLLGPEAFTKFMESETAKWGKVIKQGNIKLE